MKKYLSIFAFSFAFFGCQTTPLTTNLDTEITDSFKTTTPTECTINSTTGECALELTSIQFDLPNQECQVYDLLVQIDTDFIAPAGLENGSTARIDWEFLPNGNAGFWLMPIAENNSIKDGTIRINGCFSYGEQDTLKITRSISDQNHVESNLLSIDIPKPAMKVNSNQSSTSGFEVIDNSYN